MSAATYGIIAQVGMYGEVASRYFPAQWNEHIFMGPIENLASVSIVKAAPPDLVEPCPLS
jgi:hypothetical protein